MDRVFEFFDRKKILGGFVVLGILVVVFFLLYVNEVTAEEAFTCPSTENSVSDTPSQVIVDVKGAVAQPGVYRLDVGSIVEDAIVLAGGLLESADTSNLNLSKQLTNEMVITVFTHEEVLAMDLEKEPVTEDDETTQTGLISINTATIEELMTLPGIGESKAQMIIEYRETCGNFTKTEELMNISGIGESVYEKLLPYITL